MYKIERVKMPRPHGFKLVYENVTHEEAVTRTFMVNSRTRLYFNGTTINVPDTGQPIGIYLKVKRKSRVYSDRPILSIWDGNNKVFQGV